MTTERYPKLLIFAPQTGAQTARSGVHRVVIEAARALARITTIALVKWDYVEGQLRHFDTADLNAMFGPRSWPDGVAVNRYAHRLRYRFSDSIDSEDRVLICPEVSHHISNGDDVFRRLISQAREYNLLTAAIFYDLIPVTNPDYLLDRIRHLRYLDDLLRVDLILPISYHSGDSLLNFYQSERSIARSALDKVGPNIIPTPLAEVGQGRPLQHRPTVARAADIILSVGTIEPRKQQLRVIRTFQRRRIAERYGLRLVFVGSLHYAVSNEFRALVDADPSIDYHGYVPDSVANSLFERARFSVFASNDEGFGLPICESLASGVPCLAANFGSMAKIGRGGGCMLVNVNDDNALAEGLERLAADDTLLESLRSEIARRVLRTWDDYARDVLGHCRAGLQHYAIPGVEARESGVRRSPKKAAEREPECRVFEIVEPLTGVSWHLYRCRALRRPSEVRRFMGILRSADCHLFGIHFAGGDHAFEEWSTEDFFHVLTADALFFNDEPSYRALVSLAGERDFPGMLGRCEIISAHGTSDDTAIARLRAMAGDHQRRHLIAQRELHFETGGHTPEASTEALLTIIVSTYNRSAFVTANVRWLLSHLQSLQGLVDLIVVDNASTDDTEERLASFTNDTHFRYFRNNANVGMLGNLQVCSTVVSTKHVWIIGDDDFIVPENLAHVVHMLIKNPNIPFIFVNFGVYYRERLGDLDTVQSLMKHQTVLAPSPSPSGRYKVREIATEHDNLFTAVYPIIFRSDIASVCFNYPFTGIPFSSLTESIPTTKLILQSYAETEALWLASPAIVGNAHNSWRHYRVYWHGVLMPLAFELARRAGVDEKILHKWSRIHVPLYEEAKTLFRDSSAEEYFSRADLDASFSVFRKWLFDVRVR